MQLRHFASFPAIADVNQQKLPLACRAYPGKLALWEEASPLAFHWLRSALRFKKVAAPCMSVNDLLTLSALHVADRR